MWVDVRVLNKVFKAPPDYFWPMVDLAYFISDIRVESQTISGILWEVLRAD